MRREMDLIRELMLKLEGLDLRPGAICTSCRMMMKFGYQAIARKRFSITLGC